MSVIKTVASFTSSKLDKRVQLMAYYVKVQANHSIIIYQYHVDFSDGVVHPDHRAFLTADHAKLFENAYIYDKQNTIMSTRLLATEPVIFIHSLSNRKVIQVTIHMVRAIEIDDEQM